MGINALAMSRSNGAVKVLVATFAELGTEYKDSDSVPEPLEILATEHHSALIVDFDVTEQGLWLQAAEGVTPLRGVPLRFLLPGTAEVIHAIGDFSWADGSGRAGLFFSKIAAACQRALQEWLKKRAAKRSEAVRVLLEPPRSARAAAAN